MSGDIVATGMQWARRAGWGTGVAGTASGAAGWAAGGPWVGVSIFGSITVVGIVIVILILREVSAVRRAMVDLTKDNNQTDNAVRLMLATKSTPAPPQLPSARPLQLRGDGAVLPLDDHPPLIDGVPAADAGSYDDLVHRALDQ